MSGHLVPRHAKAQDKIAVAVMMLFVCLIAFSCGFLLRGCMS